jgi:hypothetical protein
VDAAVGVGVMGLFFVSWGMLCGMLLFRQNPALSARRKAHFRESICACHAAPPAAFQAMMMPNIRA